MSYQKIYNPLEDNVRTGYKGEEYIIDSKETKGFPTEVAEHFLEIYGFLQRVETEVETVKEVVKEVVAKKEEVKKVIKK